jgi:hypothetical protein
MALITKRHPVLTLHSYQHWFRLCGVEKERLDLSTASSYNHMQGGSLYGVCIPLRCNPQFILSFVPLSNPLSSAARMSSSTRHKGEP